MTVQTLLHLFVRKSPQSPAGLPSASHPLGTAPAYEESRVISKLFTDGLFFRGHKEGSRRLHSGESRESLNMPFVIYIVEPVKMHSIRTGLWHQSFFLSSIELPWFKSAQISVQLKKMVSTGCGRCFPGKESHHSWNLHSL